METFSNYCRYINAEKTIRTDTISELYNLLDEEDKLDADEVIKLTNRLGAQSRLEREFLYSPAGSTEKQAEEYKKILDTIYGRIRASIDKNISKLFPDSFNQYSLNIGDINNSVTYGNINQRIITLINSDAFKEVVVNTDKGKIIDSIIQLAGLVFEEITDYKKEDKLTAVNQGLVIYQEFAFLIIHIIKTLDYNELLTECSQYSVSNISNLLRFFPTLQLKSFRIGKDEEITLPNILNKEEAVLFSKQYIDIFRVLSPNRESVITNPNYILLVKTARLLKDDPLFKDIREVKTNIPSLMRSIPGFTYNDMSKVYRIVALFTTVEDPNKLISNPGYTYTTVGEGAGNLPGALSWPGVLSNALLTDTPLKEDKVADTIVSTAVYSIFSCIIDVARFMAHTTLEEYKQGAKAIIDKRYKQLVYEILDSIYDVVAIIQTGKTDTQYDLMADYNTRVDGIRTLYESVRTRLGIGLEDKYTVIQPYKLPDRPFAPAGQTPVIKPADDGYVGWRPKRRGQTFINTPIPPAGPGGIAIPGDIEDNRPIKSAYGYGIDDEYQDLQRQETTSTKPYNPNTPGEGPITGSYYDDIFNPEYKRTEIPKEERSWWGVVTDLSWLTNWEYTAMAIGVAVGGYFAARALGQARAIDALVLPIENAEDNLADLRLDFQDDINLFQNVLQAFVHHERLVALNEMITRQMFRYAMAAVVSTFIIPSIITFMNFIEEFLVEFPRLAFVIQVILANIVKLLLIVLPVIPITLRGLVRYVIYPIGHVVSIPIRGLANIINILIGELDSRELHDLNARSKMPKVPEAERRHSREHIMNRHNDKIEEEYRVWFEEYYRGEKTLREGAMIYSAYYIIGSLKKLIGNNLAFAEISFLETHGYIYDPETDWWYLESEYNI